MLGGLSKCAKVGGIDWYRVSREENASTKRAWEKYTREYMERAEWIKEMLSAPVETKPKNAVGSKGRAKHLRAPQMASGGPRGSR